MSHHTAAPVAFPPEPARLQVRDLFRRQELPGLQHHARELLPQLFLDFTQFPCLVGKDKGWGRKENSLDFLDKEELVITFKRKVFSSFLPQSSRA